MNAQITDRDTRGRQRPPHRVQSHKSIPPLRGKYTREKPNTKFGWFQIYSLSYPSCFFSLFSFRCIQRLVCVYFGFPTRFGIAAAGKAVPPLQAWTGEDCSYCDPNADIELQRAKVNSQGEKHWLASCPETSRCSGSRESDCDCGSVDIGTYLHSLARNDSGMDGLTTGLHYGKGDRCNPDPVPVRGMSEKSI